MLDNLPIPPEINTQTLQSAIMLECGLLTPLYSEPQTMRAAILQWFAERQWTFEHLVNIIESRYAITRRNRTIHKRMRDYLFELTFIYIWHFILS